MELNPWSVDSIEAFSFYCCPECIFRSKEQNFFEAHALQNHDQSKDFFLEDNYETDTNIFEEDHGGFQLEFVSISRITNLVLIGWNYSIQTGEQIL